MPSIHGVEIFRAGTWNRDQYTVADLDDMVDAFSRVGFPVPVKVGHDRQSGARAFGWVKRLYRRGDRLLADFEDVPQELYELIKARGYDSVSAEIFWNLERNGVRYPRVLKAVALLGAETPAVSGLAPLRAVVHRAGYGASALA